MHYVIYLHLQMNKKFEITIEQWLLIGTNMGWVTLTNYSMQVMQLVV